MKLTLIAATSLLFALGTALPTPTQDHAATKQQPVKRAAISDIATLGYATQNGGTSGGSGSNATTTVSTLAQFTAAVALTNTAPAIVVVKGIINGTAKVRVGSNKTIIGLPGSGFNGVGLLFLKQKNLILRNIISSNVTAANGDALTIQESTNVWVDHCEFHSALVKDKDYFDGLIDITHGSDFVTISHTYFHDHWKTSLVGHSDSNSAQDKGHLHVTYANNYWANCNSRGPSVRFGTAHIYNSLYANMSSAVNTRMGAQVLVESSVFKNVTSPITSVDSTEVGYATVHGNDLGGRPLRVAPFGNLTVPYNYTLMGSINVTSNAAGEAGAILLF